MKKQSRKITHDEKVQKCQQFLKNFQEYDSSHIDYGSAYEQYGRRKYLIKMQQVANGQIKTIQILMEDLEAFFRKEQERQLVQGFIVNTHRFTLIFDELVYKNLPKRNTPLSAEEQIRNRFENVLKNQRRDNLVRETGIFEQNESLPRNIHKDFNVFIVRGLGSKNKIEAINEFRSDRIGALVTCKAIVIRTTQVKPQLLVATYACDVCGCENYFDVLNESFGPMTKCQSKKCIENKINGKLTFLPGHSTFISYQELKIQETPDQLKEGKIPRTFPVYARGSLVKQASPGDIIVFQGILMTHRRAGFKHEHDLAFDTHLQAYKIIREKKKYIEMNITEEQSAEIESVRANTTEDDIFEKLAKSIAPQIYGMQEVKKALLLLMAGGITKQTNDNMKIRGQINIALIGDPGVAKSQILKHIASLAPRGVYTTGKGSSGVGLTAAIVKDPFTQELALEAGALVLADMGVCCIDEFDKMDEYDRTAIHEVMEQQTISIAKAGITTTLNARTSILAAANPLYGRYDKRLTPHRNINLPAALLSRFDLIFILLDTADQGKDIQLAKHIGLVHQLKRSPIERETFSQSFLRTYIAESKNYEPTISEDLHQQIINRYVKKRQQQMDVSKEGENYTTMRSLLALIRLCQARARLRFSSQVSRSDINDCLQIIEESQKSVLGMAYKKNEAKDNISAVFQMIKDLCVYKENKSVEISLLRKRVLARGHAQDILELTLNHYSNLDVIMMDGDYVRLID